MGTVFQNPDEVLFECKEMCMTVFCIAHGMSLIPHIINVIVNNLTVRYLKALADMPA